ncbi:hypothetical protein [Candidatus Epulonipiscium viviparus]|uniref:hypothetical protein n=1 Tax=Candidatus Epulonipiscium viviparus TaxID=420336 RepID=UPI0027381064|nr:hypothetical protein [Candidatus Epulopiscium viviparus]
MTAAEEELFSSSNCNATRSVAAEEVYNAQKATITVSPDNFTFEYNLKRKMSLLDSLQKY